LIHDAENYLGFAGGDFDARAHRGAEVQCLDVGAFDRSRFGGLDAGEDSLDVLGEARYTEAYLADAEVDDTGAVDTEFDPAGFCF
jgi:hypothetical protein